jgi:hypothetical protein
MQEHILSESLSLFLFAGLSRYGLFMPEPGVRRCPIHASQRAVEFAQRLDNKINERQKQSIVQMQYG